jgi:hypothetical protein
MQQGGRYGDHACPYAGRMVGLISPHVRRFNLESAPEPQNFGQ